MNARGAILGLALLAVGIALGWVFRGGSSQHLAEDPPPAGHSPSIPEPVAATPPEVPPLPEHLRWIALGGGSSPDLNQVSLEDDLLLASRVFGDHGALLYAGGPGTRAVQVLRESSEEEHDLRTILGELLASRGGRDSRYRPARLRPHRSSTLGSLSEVLEPALTEGEGPLLFFIAAHGNRGELPIDSSVLLWGGSELVPSDLEELLEAKGGSARPLRIVASSCFSGGFAELAFDGLSPERGATKHDVCGLFATRWDFESSGCDPNPDRAAQESYTLHFLHALEGKDPRGEDIRTRVDLDGDQRIDLREAHAEARISALSIDLPTSTSDRFLRAFAPAEGAVSAVPLIDEARVEHEIGARLGLHDVREAHERLDEIARRRVELESAMDERSEHSDELYWSVVSELLSRWPEIDDPWHPDFQPMLERESGHIRAFLESSPELSQWEDEQEQLGSMSQTLAALETSAAPLERFIDAHDTQELAGRLRRSSPERFREFERLRECERDWR